jgi:zinc transport system substrate-binding protein
MRLLLLALLFSCSLIASATAKPNVLATIVPVHSLVANVMGDVGEPTLLLKGAASPHSFALSPSGATALSAAKRVFWVGPDMETFLPHMLTNLAPGVPVAFLEQKDITPLSLREGGAWQAHDQITRRTTTMMYMTTMTVR